MGPLNVYVRKPGLPSTMLDILQKKITVAQFTEALLYAATQFMT